jgi:hypothetical protein
MNRCGGVGRCFSLLGEARVDDVYGCRLGLGMAIQLRSDGYGYGDDFLFTGGTRIRSESRRVWNGYFFSPAGNLTGTRYFTTVIILDYEQVKMCSFCYSNYNLF